MPPIEGNFNDNLELLWDGRGVAARGPLEWGHDGTSVSLHVAIMQGDVAATGRTGDDIPHGANEFVIAAGVEGHGSGLYPGPAMAVGLAVIHGEGISMYEWSDKVELVPSKVPTAVGDAF
jgi:hypothetical protein